MTSKIQIKHSTVVGKKPTAASLKLGELAINVGDTPPTLYVGLGASVQRVGPVIEAATAPAKPLEGAIWLNKAKDALSYYSNGKWFQLAQFAARITTNTTYNIPADGSFKKVYTDILTRGIDPGVTVTLKTTEGDYLVTHLGIIVAPLSFLRESTNQINAGGVKVHGFTVIDKDSSSFLVATGSGATDEWEFLGNAFDITPDTCKDLTDVKQVLPLVAQTARTPVNVKLTFGAATDKFNINWGDGTINYCALSGTTVNHTYTTTFTGNVTVYGKP